MPTRRSDERKVFLADIIIGAIEGGTNYWAYSARYVHPDEAPENTSAFLVDMEEYKDEIPPGKVGSPNAPWHYVDIETVARGLRKIMSPGFAVNPTLLEAIKLADKENDAGEIDAGAADCIVQAGLFGELVYG